MENFFEKYELATWEAARNRDREAFLRLVSKDAVMVCGGFRCTGEDYANVISEFDLKKYTILMNETVYESETLVQVHYVIKTEVSDPRNSDLEGTYHVTSTWENKEGKWMEIFNMDSLIQEMPQ